MAEPHQPRCFKCSSTMEDALILACEHNLCLPCASNALQQRGPQDFCVGCACGTETEVHAKSAAQLRSIQQPAASTGFGQQSTGGPTRLDSMVSSTYGAAPAGNFPSTRQAAVPTKTFKQVPCPHHSEEPMQFFCLDCEDVPVCAECVVFGTHKNHNVVNIKKAVPMLKSKCEEITRNLSSRLHTLRDNSMRLNQLRKDTSSATAAGKDQIRSAVKSVVDLIGHKEAELISAVDLMGTNVAQMIDDRVQSVGERHALLETNLDQLQKSLAAGADAAVSLTAYARARAETTSLFSVEEWSQDEVCTPVEQRREALEKAVTQSVTNVGQIHQDLHSLNIQSN